MILAENEMDITLKGRIVMDYTKLLNDSRLDIFTPSTHDLSLLDSTVPMLSMS